MDLGGMAGGAAPGKKVRRQRREFELGLLTAVLGQRKVDLDRREMALDTLAKELEMLQALMQQGAAQMLPPQEAAPAPGLPSQEGMPPWMPTQ